ncbi:hypothetical protein EDB83DRAFT_2525241 [Lactarius deliciosus]|nr:hypothetical protein EDB83DRAFT_2525241 [Lactarius deliciosus]
MLTLRSPTSALEPLFAFLSYAVIQAEFILALFLAIRTRTHADNGEEHFIQFLKRRSMRPFRCPAHPSGILASVPVVSGANKPRPKLANTGKQVFNFASYNSTSLAGNETTKLRAIEIPRIMAPVAVALLDSTLSGGAMVDLPKPTELKHTYKCRFILDESIPFGTVGRTGHGLTELDKVPAMQLDLIVGSVANGLNSGPGAPRGLRLGGDQHPANMTRTLEKVRAIRVEAITIPSHAASPIIHIHMRSVATPSACAKLPNPATPTPREAPSFDIAGEERLLPDIVDEARAQGVWITRARRLRGQELGEAVVAKVRVYTLMVDQGK